jgi:hypothetical protein
MQAVTVSADAFLLKQLRDIRIKAPELVNTAHAFAEQCGERHQMKREAARMRSPVIDDSTAVFIHTTLPLTSSMPPSGEQSISCTLPLHVTTDSVRSAPKQASRSGQPNEIVALHATVSSSEDSETRPSRVTHRSDDSLTMKILRITTGPRENVRKTAPSDADITLQIPPEDAAMIASLARQTHE